MEGQLDGQMEGGEQIEWMGKDKGRNVRMYGWMY